MTHGVPRAPTLPQRAVVVFIFACRALLFAALASRIHLRDMLRVFSYLSLLITTLCHAAAFVALFSPRLLRLYALFVLPLAVQLPVSVSLTLVGLVYENGHIYTHNMNCTRPTWSDDFGRIHTQDYFVHNWPAFEAFALLLALGAIARAHVRALPRARRLLYALYVVALGVAPFAVYSALVDWHARYTRDGMRLGTGGIVALSIVIGVLYALYITPGPAKHARALPRAAPEEPPAAREHRGRRDVVRFADVQIVV